MDRTAAAANVSEQLIDRLLGPRPSWRGGPLLPASQGFLTAVVAAIATLPDTSEPIVAVILAVGALLMVLWGGMAGVMATRPGIATWKSAASTALNIAAEGIFVVAVVIWSRRQEDLPGPLAVGFLAFGGALLLSYARTRILASAGLNLADGPWGVASREARLIILAVAVLVGQPYWGLVAVAVLAHGAVLGHLVRLRATLAG